MANWKGLDPGGTEQLWDAQVLIDVLEIFKLYEPFSRVAPDSPIFVSLEEKHPDITWRSFDSNGAFRPIFRKTNPWAKLGLITCDTSDISVTPDGDELLSGEKTIQAVFIDAAKNHKEIDGIRSFSVVCQAALLLPNEIFTLEEIEYAVNEANVSNRAALIQALTTIRSSKVKFPPQSRRPRTLQSFMNALVTAGALVSTAKGWTLYDEFVAREISQIPALADRHIAQLPTAYEKLSITQTQNFKEITSSHRTPSPFSASKEATYNPVKRALLLEKANSIHEKVVQKCADVIRSLGKVPIEDQNSFDVAIQEDQIIIEVKSIHDANAISQIRKAVAQLPEYRWRHKHIFSENTLLILVTNENPAKYIEPDLIQYLRQDRGLELFWLEEDSIVNAERISLGSVIAKNVSDVQQ